VIFDRTSSSELSYTHNVISEILRPVFLTLYENATTGAASPTSRQRSDRAALRRSSGPSRTTTSARSSTTHKRSSGSLQKRSRTSSTTTISSTCSASLTRRGRTPCAIRWSVTASSRHRMRKDGDESAVLWKILNRPLMGKIPRRQGNRPIGPPYDQESISCKTFTGWNLSTVALQVIFRSTVRRICSTM